MGKTTGTVIDSGEGITHTVPIYEGYAIPHAITEIPICGSDLTKYLHSMLHSRHPHLIHDNTDGMDECTKIKEERGRVALDYDAELKQATEPSHNEHEYRLPTGTKISVKEECLKCPELLFNPSLQQNQTCEDGIH